MEALPLSQILTSEERTRLRLIKLDIEGAEPAVMREVLDTLAMYPRRLAIIVEANPHEDPDGWRAIFDRLRAADFDAYEIDNSYELAWYLKWRKPAPLGRIEVVPHRQQDLLFTRSS